MFVGFIHKNATTNLSLTLNDDSYPFTKTLDTHCEMSERPRTPKTLQPGQTATYTLARNRIWHVEGDIVASSMANYDAKRIALLNNILPVANPAVRYTAELTVTDENSHSYISLVSLVAYSCPVEPLYPGVGAYMFEWEADDPFVYRVSDGKAMYI